LIYGGVRTITLGAMLPSRGLTVNDFSQLPIQAHVDDRTLLDLFEPGIETGVELCPEQDVPDLRLDAVQPLAFQRLLRFEAKDVVAERRPVRGGDRLRAERDDLGLDILGELAALERPKVAAVPGAGVPRMLARQLREVGALEQLGPEHVCTDARRLPAHVGSAAPRPDQ